MDNDFGQDNEFDLPSLSDILGDISDDFSLDTGYQQIDNFNEVESFDVPSLDELIGDTSLDFDVEPIADDTFSIEDNFDYIIPEIEPLSLDEIYGLDDYDYTYTAPEIEPTSLDDIYGLDEYDLEYIIPEFEPLDIDEIFGDVYEPEEDTIASDSSFDFGDWTGDSTDDLGGIADDVSRFEEIAELVETALNENVHPSDLEGQIQGLADDSTIEDILENYTDALMDKLGLSQDESFADDNNYTDRGAYASYDDILAYLDTFYGGFPSDDIFEIRLTSEGWELYVAVDTP